MLFFPHPLIASLLTYIIFGVAMTTFSNLILTQFPVVTGGQFMWTTSSDSTISSDQANTPFSFYSSGDTTLLRGAGVGLIAYWLLIIGLRVVNLGSHNLYECLWGCNIGLFFGGFALLMDKPLWVTALIFALSIDQVLWYLDVLLYFLTGKFVIGVAAYLTWPQTHFLKKITCGHHLWFIPFLCWMLRHHVPTALSAFPPSQTILLGLVVEFLFVACPRFFLPCYALWPDECLRVRRESQRTEKGGKISTHLTDPNVSTESNTSEALQFKGSPLAMQYLNVNLSYDSWKDVTLFKCVYAPDWLSPDVPWYLFIPYQNAAWAALNIVLCTPMFLLM